MANSDVPDIDGLDVDGMCESLETTDVEFAVLFGSHARETADTSSDFDVLLGFPEEMDDTERFRARNRIDAGLQQYATGFVDVSDAASLPTHVLRAALDEGVVLVGDSRSVERYRAQIEQEYKATAEERERERLAFIDRLARGDT